MSYYETPEQRQIRELRSTIAAMTARSALQTDANRKLKKELENVRNQQAAENMRLQQQIEEQAANIGKERAAMSSAVSELNREIEEKERLQNEKIKEMQDEYGAKLNALNERHAKENASLEEKIKETQGEMRRGMDEMRKETDEKIKQERRQTQRNMEQMERKLRDNINGVNRRVSDLEQEIRRKESGQKELAEYWSQEAVRLVRLIKETSHAQLLPERKMEGIERNIDHAVSDIKSGQYTAAIISGRTAFDAALDLKGELAEAELEWNYHFNAVKMREAALLEALEDAQNRVYSVELEGEKIEDDRGIDYWTNGQLGIVQRRIEEQRARLADIDGFTTAELGNAEEALHSLGEELALIENTAHTNFAMSLSRYDTAAKIGEILGDSFRMTECDGEYFMTEWNEEYHAIFQNPVTNDQVAVVIVPIPDEAGVVTNHIELIMGNSDNNPVTRSRMTEAVEQKMRESGVEGCSFSRCAGRYGDGSITEAERVGDISAVEAGENGVRASRPLTAPKEKNDGTPSGIVRTTKRKND
ncbi:MAG: hypothetical protein IJW76_02175 [Clostridia bacterium]|nr:hypothetical protein [Clostridia bacterium]